QPSPLPRAYERPILPRSPFLYRIILDVPNGPFDVLRIQIDFPLPPRKTLGTPTLLVPLIHERMDPRFDQLLGRRTLQLNHRLFDFHLRPAGDEVDVVGHHRTSIYGEARFFGIVVEPSGDGHDLRLGEVHGRP